MAGFSRLKAFLLLLFYVIAILPELAHSTPINEQPLPLASLCNSTTSPTLCLATLSKFPSAHASALLQDLTAFLVSQALTKVNQTLWIGKQMASGTAPSSWKQMAGAAAQEDGAAAADGRFTLQDCLEMLDNAVDGLNRSVGRLSHLDAHIPADSLREQVMDVRVWLSSSLTYVDTCWDEIATAEAALLKARFSILNHDIEPLLAIALSLAQTLQEAGGASTSYALPRHQLISSSPILP